MIKILILLFFSFPLFAHAQPLKVGALNLPPFYILDETESKVMGGIFINRLQKVFERAGIQYTLSGYPPARLYKKFAEGSVDVILASTGNAVIEGKGLVAPLPLGDNLIELYSLLPMPQIPESIAGLEGKSVIIINGYSYAGLLIDLKAMNVKLEVARNHEAAIFMLKERRAPYALVYQGVADESVAATGLQKKIKSKTMRKLQVEIQINKNVPKAQEIMDKSMKALKELQAEGAFVVHKAAK